MSTFIVRVEIHEPFNDYALLHSLMGNAGFERQIRSDTGDLFQLPPGEYVFNIAQDFTAVAVRDYARQTANRVCSNNSVLVSRYDQAAWYLRPASTGLAGLFALSA